MNRAATTDLHVSQRQCKLVKVETLVGDVGDVDVFNVNVGGEVAVVVKLVVHVVHVFNVVVICDCVVTLDVMSFNVVVVKLLSCLFVS